MTHQIVLFPCHPRASILVQMTESPVTANIDVSELLTLLYAIHVKDQKAESVLGNINRVFVVYREVSRYVAGKLGILTYEQLAL